MVARVLIVDDSPTMQQLLSAMLSSDPQIEIAGVAGDASSARALIKETNPDVVTLDVEMPGMNGLQFLEKIMNLRPMPVVMISSHTQKGADASVDALAIGAFACLTKPRLGNDEDLSQMLRTIKSAARSRIGKGSAALKSVSSHIGIVESRKKIDPNLIVVGSSTGGVEALMALFGNWPSNCPPTVVVQHMPSGFTKSLANRLNTSCLPTVLEAENYAVLERGHIYIAPGSVGHTTLNQTDRLRINVRAGEPVNGHMPSVDQLFMSAKPYATKQTVGIVLTGMGADGAAGLLALRNAGAHTISQNEETCLVYGMPAAAEKLDASVLQMSPQQVGQHLFSSQSIGD